MPAHRLVVQKFGGTSVEDARAMARVIEIVRTQGVKRRQRPLVVLSASAGVTDALLRVSEYALRPRLNEALLAIDQLEARHARTTRELLNDAALTVKVQAALHRNWEELRQLARGIHLLRELTPKSRDQIVSLGERCSTLIFHAGLTEALGADGPAVHYLDAREFFTTNADFTNARPQIPEIRKRMRPVQKLLQSGAIGVTQGFIGATADGEVTTIGRGGSDVSAAIQGVAIEATEIQIWTDVVGIMTCDPRLAPAATTIPTISFRDASELAHFGAKVLHPATIRPAIDQGIPVRILSSREPAEAGTIILERHTGAVPITGIALRKGITLVRVVTDQELPEGLALQTTSDALAEARTTPLAVSISQNSALYALEESRAVATIRKSLPAGVTVTTERDRALVTLVGPGLYQSPGIASRIFRGLGRTNCEMISYGGSATSVSLVIEEALAPRVVKRLHAEFFE